MGYEYQTVIPIPLELENMRPNRSLARPVPRFVYAKVSATGWQIIGLPFVPAVHYALDVGDISNRYNFSTAKDMMERLRLPQGIRTIEIKPETVAVVLDEKTRKMVPVEPLLRMSFREGYGLVGDIKTAPDSVLLTGAKTLLERVERWPTNSLEFSNLKNGVVTRAILSDTLAFGVTPTPTSVSVQFDVQPTAEKTLKGIAVEVNHVPGNRLVVLIPPKIDIIIRGGIEQVAAAELKDFSAYIDYRSILLDTTGSLQPVVTMPRNIKVVSQEPARLQYVVRK